MDFGQWLQLLGHDSPSRGINHRYLVIPVRQQPGVFHPKLHFIFAERQCRVICGSANLTRAGCSHNLEILNALSLDFDSEAHEQDIPFAKDGLRFFELAAEQSVGESGELAKEWILELRHDLGWHGHDEGGALSESVRLLHTYDGSLWRQWNAILGPLSPEHVTIISPFFDQDAALFQRLKSQWGKCDVHVIAQARVCNLPVATLKEAKFKLTLSEINESSRRLHAKLLAWTTSAGSGCIVGSANFTSPAWNGINVETCLYVPDSVDLVTGLFDKTFNVAASDLTSFVPGTEQEPKQSENEAGSLLRVHSAVLTDRKRLRLTYACGREIEERSVFLAIKASSEPKQRDMVPIPFLESGAKTLALDEAAWKDARGSLLVWLVCDDPDLHAESLPVWVIHEDGLTHDPSDGGAGGKGSKAEDTGFLIPENLEHIKQTQGIAAAIEYLDSLRIKCRDGATRGSIDRRFRLRRRDPFHPDVPPDWLTIPQIVKTNFQKAILGFVERHEDKCLKKHAARGNINGMENFLDIFIAIVRVLHFFYVRDVVGQSELTRHIGRSIEIATVGFHWQFGDSSEGYLKSLSENLRGQMSILHEVCEELNFIGHLRAAILIAEVEYVKTKNDCEKPKKARGSITWLNNRIAESCNLAGLHEPTNDRIMAALETYDLFSDEQLAKYRSEMNL
jgi:hypothetical protein